MWLWMITMVALLGTLLNAKQDRRGFLLWMISNTGLATWNFSIGEYAQATLFSIYLVLAVYGFFTWTKTSKKTLDRVN